MKISIESANERFSIDPNSGISLAIELRFDGAQPNHFGAPMACTQPLRSGDFVGDTRQGGSCNVGTLTITPHCNGTHTETVGHIVNDRIPICEVLTGSLMLATLISVQPVAAANCGEKYLPDLVDTDEVITSTSLAAALEPMFLSPALIIRTEPNPEAKQTRNYMAGLPPPFFTHEAMLLLNELQIKHLLVDLPSIDRTFDEGKLSNHHLFWNVGQGTRQLNEETWRDKTITELIYVPQGFTDGVYFLDLQVPPFNSDAAPSRPVLFQMA